MNNSYEAARAERMTISRQPTKEGIVNGDVTITEKDSLLKVVSHLQLAIEGCQSSLTELEQWKSRAMTAELMNEQFAKTIDDCTKTMDNYERQLASWKARAYLAEEKIKDHGHSMGDGSGNYNVTKMLVESNLSQEADKEFVNRISDEEKRDDFLEEALAETDEESCFSNLMSDDDSTSMSNDPEVRVPDGTKEIFRKRKWELHEMVKSSTGNRLDNRAPQTALIPSSD